MVAGGDGGAGGGSPYAEFSIRTGDHATSWYSRRGTDVVGELLSGSLQLTDGPLIERIGYAAPSFRFNRARSGSGSFEDWQQGAGAGRTVTVRTPEGTLTLAVSAATAGAGFIRWALNADLQAHAAAVTAADGDEVRITIG